MTLKKFALKTDYAVLIQQKQTLLNILDHDLLNAVQDQDLLGLINFLDAFQDAVVDSGVLPEAEVFPA
jgi:hypothetical protein